MFSLSISIFTLYDILHLRYQTAEYSGTDIHVYTLEIASGLVAQLSLNVSPVDFPRSSGAIAYGGSSAC